MADPDGVLSAVRGALASRRSQRSPLFQWLLDHREAFGAELAAARAAGRRPGWDELARLFAEAGLTDGDGKAPSAARARATWHRVRRRRVEPAGADAGAVPARSPDEQPASTPGDVLARFRAKVNERSGRKG